MSADRWTLALAVDLPESVESDLAARFDIVRVPVAAFHEPRNLAASLDGVDAVLVFPTLRLDPATIDALPPSVRVIATYSVGVEHIDLSAAARNGIAVLNTPDVLTNSVAEAAMLLLLGAARRATEHIGILRSGQWTGVAPRQLLGVELDGKRLGVLGMGRIGNAVAVRAAAFGMSVGFLNRSGRHASKDPRFLAHRSLDELLAASDVLLISCPGTPETYGLIDAQRLAALKPGAIVVNVSRGTVVVDDALIAALESGHVRAAGLDVFNNEPRIDQRYFSLPTVFMLPHIGSATVEARRRMGQALIDGIDACRHGRIPENLVQGGGS